jgi:hypothetical protein
VHRNRMLFRFAAPSRSTISALVLRHHTRTNLVSARQLTSLAMARKPNGSSRTGSLPTTDDGATPPAKVQKTAAAGSLRRSARASAVTASYVDEADQPTETETSESDMKPSSDAADNPEAGVQKAIKGLARMEKQLMRAVKKQKIEIQKSKVPVRKDGIAENAFKPRPTKSMDEGMISNAPDTKKRKRAPAVKKEIESDYEDNLGSPGDQDVDEGVPGSGEVVDKGAARPPPVNSDYLPLPWKGRLGYVRTPLSGSLPAS